MFELFALATFLAGAAIIVGKVRVQRPRIDPLQPDALSPDQQSRKEARLRAASGEADFILQRIGVEQLFDGQEDEKGR